MADTDRTVEEHRIYMVHDAWMRVINNKANPRVLYLLGYYWALCQMSLHHSEWAKRFEEVFGESHVFFQTALDKYIEGLPKGEE